MKERHKSNPTKVTLNLLLSGLNLPLPILLPSSKKRRDHAGQELIHFLYSQSWLIGVTITSISQTKILTISDLFPIAQPKSNSQVPVLDFTSEKPFKLASLLHFSCSYLGQGLPCSVYTPITGHSHQNYMP